MINVLPIVGCAAKSIGQAALKFHMEGAKHQTCVMDSAKPVPIAEDFHDQIETLHSCFTAILCVQKF